MLLPADDRRHLLTERLREHHDLVAYPHADIVGIRSECNGHVGRKRPGCRRPDEYRDRKTRGRPYLRNIYQPKLYVYAVRDLITVLDFGFGQSGLASGAPVDRLRALVDQTPAVEFGKDAHVPGLVLGLQREVRVVEVPAHTESLELRLLDAHVLQRIIAAERAQRGLRRLGHLHRAEVLLHLMLDGLTVAVPAGDVRRIVSAHRLVLDDEVLEHLVERRSHVDVSVGVRRPIVEDERRPVGVLVKNPAIDVHLLPEREPLGLTRGKTRSHRERRLRKVHRLLEVLLLAHRLRVLSSRRTGVRT